MTLLLEQLEIICHPSPLLYSYRGKRVFLRLDLNVPVDQLGNITDTTRIERSLPSIQAFISWDAHLILCSHFGRPSEHNQHLYSLKKIAQYLAQRLGTTIPVYSVEAFQEKARKQSMPPIIMLENIRFLTEEENNDKHLAQTIAQNIDIYINDAFSVSHREHMSVDALCRFSPESYAGPLFIEELQHLLPLIEHPQEPVVTIIGGAKLETKLPLLNTLTSFSQHILVGGNIANSLLKRTISPTIAITQKISDAIQQGRIVLPIDHVVHIENSDKIVDTQELSTLPTEAHIVDIGPKTIRHFATFIEQAKTLFWNGPLGYFECAPFHKGTHAIAQVCAQSTAYKIAGGGETLWAIHETGASHAFDWLSSGGGALLDMITYQSLPGIRALLSQHI